jgi:hypothetical protein
MGGDTKRQCDRALALPVSMYDMIFLNWISSICGRRGEVVFSTPLLHAKFGLFLSDTQRRHPATTLVDLRAGGFL